MRNELYVNIENSSLFMGVAAAILSSDPKRGALRQLEGERTFQ